MANKTELNELFDLLCQAASYADKVKFRIPEIYDIMDIVEQEITEDSQ